MRSLAALLVAICLGGLTSQPALAEKRVALTIGNANYRNTAHLANPINDAAMVADMLRKANFDFVSLRTDLTANEMRRALRDFGDKAHDADIAVIYYAGHGIEVDGNNYLIPIDAALDRDTDVYDEALPIDRLLVAVEPAKQLRLIIMDACRDNPFARTMKRTVAARAIGRGLAKVEPTSPNTMIAFAAKAGFTAFDGDGKNSPYAIALTAHLTTPGLDVRKAFGFVRDDVLKATGNKQEPFIYGSLGGNDVALVPAPAPQAAASAADRNEAIRRDYELAERVGTREAWDFFLATYPNGFYSNLALAQRNKLAAEEKARAASNERERLAGEGAMQAEQAKAAAEAKAAEDVRIAAEKKKAQEEAKVAQAERANAVAQAKAAEEARIAAEKARKADDEKAAREQAAAEKRAQEAVAQAKAAETARLAAEKATQERIARAEADAKAAAERAKAAEAARIAEEARTAELQKAIDAAKAAEAKTPEQKPSGQLAMLSPPDKPDDGKPTADQIPRLLLTELRRVGCFTGSIDGSWNDAAQKSVGLFNKYAGTRLDTKVASLDALDLLQHRSERVCPLVCDHGYKANGDSCIQIICQEGFELNDGDECVRTKRKPEAAKPERAPSANLAPPAPREGVSGGGRCAARSCSQALGGCMRRCSRNGVDCSHCNSAYNSCMRTGTFIGHVCHEVGLARN
jgi:uncharacterized caspase-like protein